ncbi:MAG: NAD(P)/FAD-dependent oxidoreductase [Phycicoccus sp.]
MRDVLVAGGGPVGLTTALHAARAGLDVAVVEPRHGTIDKACGEGLMPGAVATLHGLGVRPAGEPITGIRYLDRTRAVDAPFRRGAGRGVRRTALQAALSEAVLAAGVPVLRRPVRHVEDRGDHLLVDGEPTRYLMAADGLHSPVRRMVGLDRPGDPPRRYGQRVHVATAPWTSMVEVHWSAVGEAYVTPVSPGIVGVAVLTGERRRLEDLVAEFPQLVGRLDGPAVTSVRGAGPLRQRSRRRVQGRVLLVGDASGYVDALTGEGIALGLAQARAAVDAVARGRPQHYELAWRRLGWRHDLLTRTLLAATRHRAVRDRVVPTAAALPTVFATAVDQLARPV